MKNGTADGVRDRPDDRAVRRPLSSTTPTSTAAARTRRPTRPPTSTAGRWTASSARPSPAARAAWTRPTRPAPTRPQPDVMGYHTQSDIPNYWTYAKDFVLQDHMFEPNASWSLPVAPVPGVGVVGLLHPARQPVELRQRPADQAGRTTRRTRRPSTAARPVPRTARARSAEARRAGQPDLRVDRPDLPAPQAPRQLGLLRRERHRARLRERRGARPARRCSRTPARPASGTRCPGSTPCKADHQLGNIQSVDKFYAAAKNGHAARRVVGRTLGRGQRAPAGTGQLRTELRDQPDQRGDAEPRLGLDRHLPGLGRLGRLLRPRRPADRRRERLRAARAGHRHQPVREDTATSTTRP